MYRQHANDAKVNIFAKEASVRRASVAPTLCGHRRTGSQDLMSASPSELALAANALKRNAVIPSSGPGAPDHSRHKEIAPTFDADGERMGEEGKREDADECYEYVFWLMTKTSVGFYFDLWQAVISVVSCGIYVWGTYRFDYRTTIFPVWLVAFEVTVAIFFFIELCLHVYLSPSRCQYMVSWGAILDVLTIVPVAIVLWPDEKLGVIRLLRGIRILITIYGHITLDSTP